MYMVTTREDMGFLPIPYIYIFYIFYPFYYPSIYRHIWFRVIMTYTPKGLPEPKGLYPVYAYLYHIRHIYTGIKIPVFLGYSPEIYG